MKQERRKKRECMSQKQFFLIAYFFIIRSLFSMEISSLKSVCITIELAIDKFNLKALKDPLDYMSDMAKNHSDRFLCEIKDIRSPVSFHMDQIFFYRTLLQQNQDFKEEDKTEIKKHIKKSFDLFNMLYSAFPMFLSSGWKDNNNLFSVLFRYKELPTDDVTRVLISNVFRANLDVNLDVNKGGNSIDCIYNGAEGPISIVHVNCSDPYATDDELYNDPINNTDQENGGHSSIIEKPVSNFAFTIGPSKKDLEKLHEDLRGLVLYNRYELFNEMIGKDNVNLGYAFQVTPYGYVSLLSTALDKYLEQRNIYLDITGNEEPDSFEPIKNSIAFTYNAARCILYTILNKKPVVNCHYVYDLSNPNAESLESSTPLKEAIKYDDRTLVFQLMKAGANPYFKEAPLEKTALEYAQEKNCELYNYMKSFFDSD